LCCENCKSIHHEIPDILTPYKHYETGTIENAVTASTPEEIATGVEESTLRRWKAWYERVRSLYGQCIDSLKVQLNPEPRVGPSVATLSAHQKDGHQGGKKSPPLVQMVRVITNGNFWGSTQLACLSG